MFFFFVIQSFNQNISELHHSWTIFVFDDEALERKFTSESNGLLINSTYREKALKNLIITDNINLTMDANVNIPNLLNKTLSITENSGKFFSQKSHTRRHATIFMQIFS